MTEPRRDGKPAVRADAGGRRAQIPWAREELVLACDLVRQNDWAELRASDPRVVELSDELQIPFAHPLSGRPPNFRSPNSVSRKTADIVTRLPHYRGKPTKGGRLDKVVLDEFLEDPAGMVVEALRLRRWIHAQRWHESSPLGHELTHDAGLAQPPMATAPPGGPRPAGSAGPVAESPPAASQPPEGAEPLAEVDPTTSEARLARSVVESELFKAQAQRSGRAALSADVAYRLVAALLLDRRHAPPHRLMASAGLPARSAAPTLAALRRLLNVDGYEVISLDAATASVRIDRGLLADQFALAHESPVGGEGC